MLDLTRQISLVAVLKVQGTSTGRPKKLCKENPSTEGFVVCFLKLTQINQFVSYRIKVYSISKSIFMPLIYLHFLCSNINSSL